jgi:hypothetical protein
MCAWREPGHVALAGASMLALARSSGCHLRRLHLDCGAIIFVAAGAAGSPSAVMIVYVHLLRHHWRCRRTGRSTGPAACTHTR